MGRAVVYDLAGAREVTRSWWRISIEARAQEVARKFGRGKARGVCGRARYGATGEAAARLRRGGELHAVQLESGGDARGAGGSR